MFFRFMIQLSLANIAPDYQDKGIFGQSENYARQS